MKTKFAREELTLGALVILAIFCLVFLTYKLGKFNFAKTNTYICKFKNIHGISEQTNVFYRGVKVGGVDKILINEENVNLFLKIKKNIPIRSDAICSIKSKSILGDNFVEIIPGNLSTRILKDSEQIENTEELEDMQTIFSNLSIALAQAKDLATNFSQLLKENKDGVKTLIINLNAISHNLKQGKILADVLNRLSKILALTEHDYPKFRDSLLTLSSDIDKIIISLPDELKDTREILMNLKKVLANLAGFDKETLNKLILDFKKFLKTEGINVNIF
jgi:phospholipid/cholesterol/gamma-HCH transport system substrate-binding protein